ncbi:hypothetical protein IH970_08805 [candidate division KSB1 bacterium]|nr:hypothetical protein [candidate division KSB1 bacterium]
MRIIVTCRDGLISKALFHKSAHANTAIRLVQRVNPHIGGSVLRIVDREVDPALGLVTIQHRRAHSADGRGNDIAGEHLDISLLVKQMITKEGSDEGFSQSLLLGPRDRGGII